MAKETWLISDAEQESFRIVTDIDPILDRDDRGDVTGEQKRDRGSKLPLWELTVSIREPGAKSEQIRVRVPSASEPALLDKRPHFIGLRSRLWTFNGRAGLSLTADEVMDAASIKRPPAPRTPPAPAPQENAA